MGESIIYLAAFVVLLAVASATACMAVRRNGRGVGELIKQLVLCVAIAVLLPLMSYAGATLIHPPKPMKDLMAERQRVQQDAGDAFCGGKEGLVPSSLCLPRIGSNQ